MVLARPRPVCQEESLSSDNNPFSSCLELHAQDLATPCLGVSCPGLLVIQLGSEHLP